MQAPSLHQDEANPEGNAIDIEMSGGDGSDLDLSIVSYLQNELAKQASSSSSSGPSETPVKRKLRYELAEVVDVASNLHTSAEKHEQQFQEDAYLKMRRILDDQKQIRKDELAAQSQDLESKALDVIKERDDRLTHEAKALRTLRTDLKRAEDIADEEFTQRNTLMREASLRYDSVIAEANSKHDAIIAEANARSRENYESLLSEARAHVKAQHDATLTFSNELQDRLNKSESLCADLQGRLARAESSLTREVNEHAKTRHDKNVLSDESTRMSQTLRDTMNGGHAEIDRLNSAIEDLQSRLNVTETLLNASETQLQKASAEKQILQIQIQNLEAGAGRSSECSSCQVFSEKVHSLESQLSELENLKTSLHDENVAMKQSLTEEFQEHDKLSAKVKEWENTLRRKDNELDDARCEIERLLHSQSLNPDSSELDEARKQIHILQDELIELQQQIAQQEVDEEFERLVKATSAASTAPRSPFTAAPAPSKNEPSGQEDGLPKGGEDVKPKGSVAQTDEGTGISIQGRTVDDKIDIKPWPSIAAFRVWRLSFKKSVAAASQYPKEAFTWITEVETAKTMEELDVDVIVIRGQSYDFSVLSAKLAKDIEKIFSGEFKRKVNVKEIEVSKEGRMMTGRQLVWMMYQHFQMSDVDSAMQDWDEFIHVELKGDNLPQFWHDWETACLNVRDIPDERFLETLYRKQLMKSESFKQTLALYNQDIAQGRSTRDYNQLKNLLNLWIESNRLERNKNAWDKSKGQPTLTPAAKGKAKAKAKAGAKRPGDCHQWKKSGQCSRGDSCPWSESHTEDKAGKKRENSRDQSRGRSQERGRKGDGKGKRGNTPPARGRSKSKEIPKKGQIRGKSPKGTADRPPCYNFLKGKCTKGDECDNWHPPNCKFYKDPKRWGPCLAGKGCNFVHCPDYKKGYDAYIQAAKAEANPSDKPQGQMTLLSGGFIPFSFSGDSFPMLCQASNKVQFTKSATRLAGKHEKHPSYEKYDLKAKDFVPRKTSPNGKVVMDSKEQIALSENWFRQKALKDFRHLYPEDPITAKDFFKPGAQLKGKFQKKLSAESAPAPSEVPKVSSKEKMPVFKLQSKGPKTRKFLVDSGASFHLVSKESLSQKESKTVHLIPFPIEIQTANGVVTITECCQVFIHELGIKVNAMILNNTIAVLSLGRLVDDEKFECTWRPGKPCTLTSPEGKVTECPAHHNVPFLFPSSEILAEAEPEATKNDAKEVPPPPVPEVPRPPKGKDSVKSLG